MVLSDFRGLLAVDEQKPHRGVGQEVEQLVRLVEVRNHDGHCAEMNRAEPGCDIVEAVGAKQQQAGLRGEAQRSKRAGISFDQPGEIAIADRLTVGDDGGLGFGRRAEVAADQHIDGIDPVRNFGVAPCAPVG